MSAFKVLFIIIVVILNIVIEISSGHAACCHCMDVSSSPGGTTDCHNLHGGIECQNTICNVGYPGYGLNPSCCTTAWTQACVDEATEICYDTDHPTSNPTTNPTPTPTAPTASPTTATPTMAPTKSCRGEVTWGDPHFSLMAFNKGAIQLNYQGLGWYYYLFPCDPANYYYWPFFILSNHNRSKSLFINDNKLVLNTHPDPWIIEFTGRGFDITVGTDAAGQTKSDFNLNGSYTKHNPLVIEYNDGQTIPQYGELHIYYDNGAIVLQLHNVGYYAYPRSCDRGTGYGTECGEFECENLVIDIRNNGSWTAFSCPSCLRNIVCGLMGKYKRGDCTWSQFHDQGNQCSEVLVGSDGVIYKPAAGGTLTDAIFAQFADTWKKDVVDAGVVAFNPTASPTTYPTTDPTPSPTTRAPTAPTAPTPSPTTPSPTGPGLKGTSSPTAPLPSNECNLAPNSGVCSNMADLQLPISSPYTSCTSNECLYVSPTSNCYAGCGSINNPYKTIQAAIDNNNGWKTIILSSGIYTGSGNYNMNKPFGGTIKIYSASGPDNTIIDCQGNGYGFYFYSATVEMKGLTVRNCVAPQRVLPYVYPAFSGRFGGAFYLYQLTATFTDMIIRENDAEYGGAIFSYQATIIFRNSNMYRNCASKRGGGIYLFYGSASIENTILSCNDAEDAAGGIYNEYASTNIILQSEISYNDATSVGNEYFCKQSSVNIDSGNGAKIFDNNINSWNNNEITYCEECGIYGHIGNFCVSTGAYSLNPWIIGIIICCLFIFGLICIMKLKNNKKTHYDQVKYVDSEQYDDSEINAINISN